MKQTLKENKKIESIWNRNNMKPDKTTTNDLSFQKNRFLEYIKEFHQNIIYIELNGRDFLTINKEMTLSGEYNGIRLVKSNQTIIGTPKKSMKYLYNCINELRKDKNIVGNVTRNNIWDSIYSDLINNIEIWKNEDTLLDFEVKKMIKKLKIKRTYIVIAPIENLQIINNDSFQLGDSYIISNQDKLFEEKIEKIFSIIKFKCIDLEKMKNNWLLDNFIDQWSLFITTIECGSRDMAEIKAFEKCRIVLNGIRTFLEIIDIGSDCFGLPGKISLTHYYETYTTEITTSEEKFDFTSMYGINTSPMILDMSDIRIRNNTFLSFFHQLLQKKQLTEIESRILRSIYWIGSGIESELYVDSIREESTRKGYDMNIMDESSILIKYMTALESLIKTRYDSTDKFCLNVAFLFSTDKTIRNEIYHRLRTLYRNRSEIIHGSSLITNQENIDKLKEIDITILKIMIDNVSNLSDENALHAWYDNLCFL